MDKTKDKKKTLTISKTLTKKIDISSLSKDGKKSFSIEKKKPFRPNKELNKNIQNPSINRTDNAKKIFQENLLNSKLQKHL